ncbi:MAG: Guanosine-5'-triphosphate,3'-diphosphate pyrophosphatase [Lentisphaerae bacterium ADurb.BinA184]|nr:MAG: Guanosine-5'-triphosphate,3'-diphosphate pyrophosphatase [Lentisphaerae bacterium ADurb.BinA184]
MTCELRNFATLDIGTNSTLLLLAREQADGTLVEDRELFRITRLGRGLGATGRLSPEAVRATLDAVGEFMAAARAWPLRPLFGVAAATSAVRDAANRADFLGPCRDLLGCEPRTLDGDEEAQTVFLGAASDRPAGRPVVTIDIGGGSTEVVAGVPEACRYRVSLDMGCVRFGERFRLYEVAESADTEAARGAIRETLAGVPAGVRRAVGGAGGFEVVASGGTATTFAAVEQALETYDRGRVHGFVSPAAAVESLALRLLGMPSARRAQVPGLEAGRAAVLPAGLLILAEALRALGAERFTVTTRGLRFGLARRLQAGTLDAQWTWG